MCAQRRLGSAWVSTQSDQSLRCPHEESLGPYLPTERTEKTDLIWVFAGCIVILLVLSWGGSFMLKTKESHSTQTHSPVHFLSSSPSISFFTLLHHESGIQLQELDHTTDTSCCKELWDIGFDNDHRLWLLQARQEQTVIVCRCLQDGNQLQVLL